MPSTPLYESRICFLHLQSAYLAFQESLLKLSEQENNTTPETMESFDGLLRTYFDYVNQRNFQGAAPCLSVNEEAKL